MPGAAIGVTLATTALSTGLSISQASREKKFLNKQERLRKAQLERQAVEELELAEIRETLRLTSLSEALGAQSAILSAAGITGGATATIISESSILASILDRRRDQTAVENRVQALRLGIAQADLSIQQSNLTFVMSSLEATFSGISTGTKAVAAEIDRRSLKDN